MSKTKEQVKQIIEDNSAVNQMKDAVGKAAMCQGMSDEELIGEATKLLLSNVGDDELGEEGAALLKELIAKHINGIRTVIREVRFGIVSLLTLAEGEETKEDTEVN